ncbi:hypothetical protein [Halopiger goleimassiliensis]|uniref:hypothetical protein n=1 Tax=Halopiger goleimassiliensis TaxID=1293048 RepID=UPI000677D50D|nr:hypothetical protein [Halopiger goleimassiliensis]
MRRIYESDALERDDGPFTPSENDPRSRVQTARSVDSTALSRWLVPQRVRYRAISVEISTPQTSYAGGDPIPFTITMSNALPVPVVLRTDSPVRWTWAVDGKTEASERLRYDPPAEPGQFRFDRGERKRFRRRWDGLFRVSDSEWVPAEPGDHTIGVRLNVPDAAAKGLAAETTVRIQE